MSENLMALPAAEVETPPAPELLPAAIEQLMTEPELGAAESSPGGTVVTSNTKLAATYLVFGYKLRRNDPFYWIDNYQAEDVEKYGLKKAPYKARCFFNLVPVTVNQIESAKGIGAAFTGGGSQEMLFSYVAGLGTLTPTEKHHLLFLCAVAIAEGCRKVQEKREFLFKEIKQMPPEAKWVRVWNGKIPATFGRNASLETRTQCLNRIGCFPGAKD